LIVQSKVKREYMPHNWIYEDDILVFYLYRYGDDNKISIQSVSKYLSIKNENAVKMRIGNFRACDGQGGLSNYAKLTKKVYDDYRYFSQEKHRQKCLEIMNIT